jgi:NAD(P)-dependent dehydrogenase (short-subunit alcohol dehydrogenase family)
MKKSVLIVGGAGGIGRTVARAFHEKGHQVILADLNEERLSKTSSELNNIPFFQVDVRDEKSVAKLMKGAYSTHGRIDSVFAVHGVTAGNAPVFQRTLEEWEFVLGTNLTGTFLCIKHIAPYMIRQSTGCIVALTTSRARPQDAPYYTSKMGIEGLVGTAAQDLVAHGIGVFVVAPGGYLSTNFHDHSYELMKYTNFVSDTEMRNQRKAIRPEVVVPVLTYLSDEVPLSIVGRKITAIDWNEEHGLGRENWYYSAESLNTT